MVLSVADNGNPASLASRMRAARNRHFRDLIDALPRPLSILDVGGTPAVWERIGFAGRQDVEITLINLEPQPMQWNNITAVAGDARDMSRFATHQFDVVYSNSVIEHVGDRLSVERMAAEVQRVGKHYFLQTPNRYFPIEPHFVFPFFQFLPRFIRIELLRRFELGWMQRQNNPEHAARDVDSINLLSKPEVRDLFPGAKIELENVLGLAKSIMAHNLMA
jgi:SAM-dependent methyltransferase